MNFVKRIIRRSVRNELIWRALDASVLRAARFIDWARGDDERVRRFSVNEVPRAAVGGRDESLMSRAFPPSSRTLEVLAGPFAGLRYPATAELRRRFERSHLVVAVTSIPDHRKPELYANAALESFADDERRRLLAEHRPGEMVWLYMTPRADVAD